MRVQNSNHCNLVSLNRENNQIWKPSSPQPSYWYLEDNVPRIEGRTCQRLLSDFCNRLLYKNSSPKPTCCLSSHNADSTMSRSAILANRRIIGFGSAQVLRERA